MTLPPMASHAEDRKDVDRDDSEQAPSDQGRTVIFPHPVLVYMENPYWDRERPCKMTGRPSLSRHVVTRRLQFVVTWVHPTSSVTSTFLES